MLNVRRGTLALAAIASVVIAGSATAKSSPPFINQFHSISTIASTVPTSGPAKGDQNPYGVAVVPGTIGKLVAGDVLVSNFNDAANAQGTGSTIMQISPAGKASVFAIVPQPTTTKAVGLTTALAALPDGFVAVGSLPAPGGKPNAARAGAITILNSSGTVVDTLSGGNINGPWDMTAVQSGGDVDLFVTNVLNGTVAAGGKDVARGTVVRIVLRISSCWRLHILSDQVIATGFLEHTDPNALVVGPTGVGLGYGDTLYVADSVNSRIAAIPDALTRTTVLDGGGQTVTSGGALSDPLGLTIAPGGDIVTVNGANGNVVETNPAGHQVAKRTLVPSGAGDLFGLAVAPHGDGLYFVDDAGSGAAANSLQLLH